MSLDGTDKKIQWNLIPWEHSVRWTRLCSNDFILDLLYFLHFYLYERPNMD